MKIHKKSFFLTLNCSLIIRQLMFFTCLILVQPSLTFAQSRPKKAVIYDVVHLKDKKVIYGEIIDFDSKSGGLTIKDRFNRTYSFSREMYNYFEEDVTYYERDREARFKDTILHARKKDEFAFTLGITQYLAGTNSSFVPDDYYTGPTGGGYFFDLPICMTIGAGKYMNRKHYLGLNADVKLLSFYVKHFYSVGVNYQFQYDGMKSNVGKYIPIRLNYGFRSTTESADIPDSTTLPLQTTVQQNFDINLSSIGLEFGHGFSFIAKNKHSWNLEFCVFKNVVIKQSITPKMSNGSTPNFNFSHAGAKLSLTFTF